MEARESLDNCGVTVKGDEAPDSYRIAPRSETPSQLSGSAIASTPAMPGNGVKKKRGRPRKYSPDGSVITPLSPMPISASIPLTGGLSAWTVSTDKPPSSFKKKYKLDFENPGERMTQPMGANFTAHVIAVTAGEDVAMKIISFSQQGSRAICILAANGSISNVTLRQPNSSGGTLTYEGHFEILSLTGSFMPTDTGGTKSRTGGMSVSLAGSDGRILGGGIAGLLVAAGPVQVVIGSFLPGYETIPKPKMQKFETVIPFSVSPANPISREGNGAAYNGLKTNCNSSSTNQADNSSAACIHPSKTLADGNHTSLPGTEFELPSVPDPEPFC